MKKLFMFLAVAGLATFGTSCGSDDNKGGDDPAQKALVLSSDVTSVEKGGSVAFTVKVENKVEAGAELYIGDTKIANPAKFDNVGKFKVVAKKNGFVTSNAVEITVTEAGTGEPEPGVGSLVLTGNPAAGEVAVGDNLSFFMTDAEGVTVSGAELFKNGTKINGSEYVVASADAETTLKFTAKKGDLVSNEIVYTVKAIPATPESNFLKVGNDVYNLDGADLGVYTNAAREAIIYTAGEGADAFNFLRYKVYVNIEGTEGEDFASLDLAVILPANATSLVWPQDAPEGNVVPLSALVAMDGALVAQTAQGEEFSVALGWGAKASGDTPGQFGVELTAEEFSFEYEGAYGGLWALVQQGQGATAAKGIKSAKKIALKSKASVKLAK